MRYEKGEEVDHKGWVERGKEWIIRGGCKGGSGGS